MQKALIYLKGLFLDRDCPFKAFDRRQSDGCTFWPEGNWRGCCVDHDEAYHDGGGAAARLKADAKLLACVALAGHPFMAIIMFLGVRLFAGPLWPHRLRWNKGIRYCDSFTYGRGMKARKEAKI